LRHGLAPRAQAVALECMRGAHRQQRACYLYAFSGPGDVQELELSTSAPSLTALLAFLRNRRAPALESAGRTPRGAPRPERAQHALCPCPDGTLMLMPLRISLSGSSIGGSARVPERSPLRNWQGRGGAAARGICGCARMARGWVGAPGERARA